jgi:selenocysteine lyase/cysteine desulfurase
MSKKEGIDVAAGAGHKWLLTPEGVGYLYLLDRARERIEPTLVGWVVLTSPKSMTTSTQPWNDGTLAWETGPGPMRCSWTEGSLELLTSIGTERISKLP